MTARLDRLGPARALAQIGAVIGREFSYQLIRAVAAFDDSALHAALERLADADILFVHGLPPDSDYRFKHALIQDAAYENLLKSRRQLFHRRVAEALRDNVVGAAAEPELLAYHFSQAGLAEVAVEWWATAGTRSIERSALVEAAEQFTRALAQIANLPVTPARRRKEISIQVALITPLLHVKGYAATETKAAVERARLLIEQAESVGEPPEDSLLLFSVLYGFWVANLVAFNSDVCCDLAMQFLALAKRQDAKVPFLIGHRLVGTSLLLTGEIAASLPHYDKAISLYDPVEHRPLAARFGQDPKVSIVCFRALARWVLGYPEMALTDVVDVVRYAREISHVPSLMFSLTVASLTETYCGNYSSAIAHLDEGVALADEKGALFWKGFGKMSKGWLLMLSGKTEEAIRNSFPRNRFMAINGGNDVCAGVLGILGKKLC